jgi:hypothetical protein
MTAINNVMMICSFSAGDAVAATRTPVKLKLTEP